MQIAAPIPRRLASGGLSLRPLLFGLLLLGILAALGFVGYQRFFATQAAPPTGQVVPVRRGTVASTVNATGSVVASKQAKLVFANSGRIQDVLVNVGDHVTTGQALARLTSDTTQIKLDTARSSLASAQLKLQQLTEAASPEDLAAAQAAYDAAVAKLSDLQNGPTAADLQAARASVVAAQATLDDANGKLQTLLSGATTADRASAQAGLVSSQNALQAAQAKLDQLQAGALPADVIGAQSAVADANSSLKAAQAKLDQLTAGATQADLATAQATFDKAQADVTNTRVRLDEVKATTRLAPDIIQAQSALAGSESRLHSTHQVLDQLSAQLEQANAELSGAQAQLSASVKAADETCSRLGDSSGACATSRASTDAQQSGILKAQQTVKLLGGGGSWDQLQAQKDVLAAQSDYDAAAAALKQVEISHNLGVDLIAAQTAYDTAISSMSSARANLDKIRAGATNADLVAGQAAVDQSRTALATAQAKLDQTLRGAQDADLVAAQTAADTAQANVDSAQAKLDALGVPTPQDIQAARSAQTSAQTALASAQAKLVQLQAGPTQTDLQSAMSGVAAAAATLSTRSGSARPSDIALQQEAVRQAELGVQQAQIDQQNNTLVAPFDGVVGSIAGNPGETAPAGTTGFITLIDPNAVRVDVTVDETDVARLAVGKPATLTFDALPGRPFRGNVTAVSPSGTLSQGVVTYPVSLSIDARNQVIPAGLTASATITIDEKDDVLVVPLRGVRRQGRDQVVEVVADDGRSEPRPVRTGLQNDQLVEITDGLAEDEQIMIQGTTTRAPNAGPGVPGGGRVFVGGPGR
jgi:RND family efflux transporter MFP subunit